MAINGSEAERGVSKKPVDVAIDKLIKEYKDFFNPAFRVMVAMSTGAKPDKDLLTLSPPIAIFNLSVERSLNEAGSFSFTVDNPASINSKAEKFPYLEKDSILQPERDVIIEMGYGSMLIPVITGTIESIDVSFGNNGISQLTVKGYDYLYPLMKEKEEERPKWEKKTYSDIAKALADDHGLKTTEIEDTSIQYPSVKQEETNDFQFLKKLADIVGYEVYARDLMFHFHLPRINSAPTVSGLEWGKSLISFTPKLELSSQIPSVEVKGWDPDTQNPVTGTAATGSERNRSAGQSGSEVAVAVENTNVKRVDKREMKSQEEVQQHALALLEKQSQQLLSGNGECLGLPEIEPGYRVELLGMGTRYSTKYYVTKVSHSINSSGFKTQFSVMQNTLPMEGAV